MFFSSRMRIETNIGRPLLLIIRGPQGSGKTTLAKHFAAKYNVKYYEADQFFMKSGKYKWDPTKLIDAWNWVLENVNTCMQARESVIVTGVFRTVANMIRFLDAGKRAKYNIKVVRCTAKHNNVHHVPADTVERIRNTMEDFSGEILMK